MKIEFTDNVISFQDVIDDPIYPGYKSISDTGRQFNTKMQEALLNVYIGISTMLKGSISNPSSFDDELANQQIYNVIVRYF